MAKVLFVTSNEVLFNSIGDGLKLKSQSDNFKKGSFLKKNTSILLVGNTKIDATLVVTHYLSCEEKPDKIIVLNPVQCPDINQSLGSIIIADKVSEWDRKDSKLFELSPITLKSKTTIGKCSSGDRVCLDKITPIMQSRFVDCITYPMVKVSEFFSIPIISIGIVADYCTQNYFKLLQSNIKELSLRMTVFIKDNFSSF